MMKDRLISIIIRPASLTELAKDFQHLSAGVKNCVHNELATHKKEILLDSSILFFRSSMIAALLRFLENPQETVKTLIEDVPLPSMIEAELIEFYASRESEVRLILLLMLILSQLPNEKGLRSMSASEAFLSHHFYQLRRKASGKDKLR